MEITCRTIGGLALLRPSRRLVDVTVGVLGRALEVSPLQICAIFCASNHYHALLVVDDQQSLSRFMAHYQANLAKEAGRLVAWSGKVWSRRYDGIVVSDEPEAQWSRLKYLLAGSYASYCTSLVVRSSFRHAARRRSRTLSAGRLVLRVGSS